VIRNMRGFTAALHPKGLSSIFHLGVLSYKTPGGTSHPMEIGPVCFSVQPGLAPAGSASANRIYHAGGRG
jgi:hypothetical protein